MAEPLRRIAVLTHLFTSATREALEQLAAARERLGLQLLAPAGEVANSEAASVPVVSMPASITIVFPGTTLGKKLINACSARSAPVAGSSSMP